MDRRIGILAKKSGFAYTRYVDDLIISAGTRLEKYQPTVERIVKDCGWELSVCRYRGVGEQHRVLGIIVNTKLNVDPVYLDDLRQVLRQLVRSGSRPSNSVLASLHGKVGWVATLNPRRGRTLFDYLAAIEELP